MLLSASFFKCRICSKTTENDFYEVKEMMFGTREVFRYVLCSNCNCLQIEEIPYDMSRYYPKRYYSYQSSSLFFPLYEAAVALPAKNPVGLIYKAMNHFMLADASVTSVARLGLSKNARILDVGSGTGSFLRKIRFLGFTRLLGIDPFMPMEVNSPVVIRRIEIGQLDAGLFDLIVFNHSFEHLRDPLHDLLEAKRRLQKKGIIIVRTPVVSWAFRKFGVSWFQIDAPRHFLVFSQYGFRLLVEKAGLKLDAIRYDSDESQIVWSERYANNVSMTDAPEKPLNVLAARLLSRKRHELIRVAHKLNELKMGDQAAFYISAC